MSGCSDETEEYIISASSFESSENVTESSAKSENTIVVYICGEVNNPGIYTLEENSRISDAALAAGGFSENADVMSLNLAQKLVDGQQIIVYSVSDENNSEAASSLSSGAASSGKINLNQATKEMLTTLPGIGESKAQAIIDYRNEIGWFTSTDQLMNISGIGEKMYAKIADSVEV